MNDEDVEPTNSGYIFNPYNPNNTQITLNDVQNILIKYGVPPTINNLSIYQRAFVHKSYVKRPALENLYQNITIVEKPPNCIELSTKSNENLEFLGDLVLGLTAGYHIYRRFPKSDEGFKTDTKVAVVKNEAIGRMAQEMGLGKWLIMSRHSEECGVRTNLKWMGRLFEAFVGAIFIDYNKMTINDEHGWFNETFHCGVGFQMAQLFLENVFAVHVDWSAITQTNENYKTLLQISIQKEFKVTPEYVILRQPELLNNTIVSGNYVMGVFLCIGYIIQTVDISSAKILYSFQDMRNVLEKEGKLLVKLGEGTHKIKKKAEQMACQMALEKLQL